MTPTHAAIVRALTAADLPVEHLDPAALDRIESAVWAALAFDDASDVATQLDREQVGVAGRLGDVAGRVVQAVKNAESEEEKR